MSYSNFNTFKLFENVGINSSSDYMLSMRPNDNNVSFHSSNSIDYNNVDIMSIKNIINKAPNEDLNLSCLNGTTINPVITINNNNQDCRIMTNLNVSGNLNILDGGMIKTTGIGSFSSININKLAINGDYGSNTKYLKSGGSGSDLTWDTIASSPWTTSGNDITYGSGTTNKVKTKYIESTLGNLYLWCADTTANAITIGRSSFKTTLTVHPYGAIGKVGINNPDPDYPLHVIGSYVGDVGNAGFYGTSYGFGGAFNGVGIGAKFEKVVWMTETLFVTSDNRIKTNIVDVPDNLALQQLRSIPCRYYEYIDKLNRGSDKTIGFIAQEVKTVMPMAVTQQKDIIPDIYKNINCTWTSMNDKFNMSSTDLPNVNGIKYKFYVSNATDASDEKEIILTGNSDNTFTFDMQYINVFCYGKEVDDFNILDKNKLFTLNFSATQEIDRIQQTHITEIESLKAEVSTLKTENAELKSVIDKLKTANSFEDFKNSL